MKEKKKVKGRTSPTTIKLAKGDYAVVVRKNGREELYLPEKKSYPLKDMWQIHKAVIHLLMTTSHILGVLELELFKPKKKSKK